MGWGTGRKDRLPLQICPGNSNDTYPVYYNISYIIDGYTLEVGKAHKNLAHFLCSPINFTIPNLMEHAKP